MPALATSLISANSRKLGGASLSTDVTLAANSDLRVPTQKAVKAYVDGSIVSTLGLLEFKGSTDTSANPNYPAANQGDAYIVSVAGKIGGASGTTVGVGDWYIAIANNAGGTQASVGTSWAVIEHNLPALGSMATQDASAVTITGGVLTNVALVTSALGTPSSGTLTNCTLPVGGLTGLGSGVGTFLVTPSSANLLAALTTKTGTGSNVFATSPALTTPDIGVASGTSLSLSGGDATANVIATTSSGGITFSRSGSAGSWTYPGDGRYQMRSDGFIGWTVNTNPVGSADTALSRSSAANILLGTTSVGFVVGTGGIVGTGQTVTTSTPLLNLSQTFNGSGITFTAAKINITDTLSAADSKFIDFQIAATSKFNVLTTGVMHGAGQILGGNIGIYNTLAKAIADDVTGRNITLGSNTGAGVPGLLWGNDAQIRWSSVATGSGSDAANSNNVDTAISRSSAANLLLGSASAGFNIGTAGIIPTVTNTYDAGTSSLKLRTGYFGTSVVTPTVTASTLDLSGGTDKIISVGGRVDFYTSGGSRASLNSSSLILAGTSLAFNSSSGGQNSGDTYASRSSAANILLGSASAGFVIGTGGILATTTNIYDIGTSATVAAPRTVYAGTSVVTPALTSPGILSLGSSGSQTITFACTGSNRWNIAGTSPGSFYPEANNAADLGLATTNTIRTGYFGTSVVAPAIHATSYLDFASGSVIRDNADGTIKISNAAEASFGRLQFGGTTSSFPALKRSTTTLQVRLADDSADARLDCSAIGGAGGRKIITLLVTDPNGSALTVGEGKVFFRIPAEMNGMDLVAVAACTDTASSSGIPTLDIRRKRSGSDVEMLSTKLTVDANETDSSTAATAAVINTSNDDVLTADRIYIDCDVAGTGTLGVEVQLSFQLP